MATVGYTGVANLANTTDGFALGVGAVNDPLVNVPGLDVGDGGVVDLYTNGTTGLKSYISMESSGYVLAQDSGKIVLEVS